MRIRFRHDSLIGLRQQMKANIGPFEVFNNIIKERSHVSCLAQCDNNTSPFYTDCAMSPHHKTLLDTAFVYLH